MITDGRTLRGMVKAGFILWNDGLEKHWTGYTVRRRWVQPGPKLGSNMFAVFTYRKQDYRLRYFDGCFHPFVCRADEQTRGRFV